MTSQIWGDASSILAASGLPEDQEYYREFTDDDSRAVLTAGQRIACAWKANDADLFADSFTEDGSVLIGDEQLTSREQIRSHMSAAFQNEFEGAHVVGWPLLVRQLSAHTTLFVTEGCILYPGESEAVPERMIRATWVVRKEQDYPRLVSHQTSPVAG